MNPVTTSGPNVGWLDEELRREKSIVQALRDTVDKQQVALVDQSQRILSLEDRLTKLQAQLLQIPETTEALEHTRDEVVLMLSEMREAQQKREADFLRNRQAEREHDGRALQEMRLDIERIPPLEQALAVRQAEERRLSETILRAQQEREDIRKQLVRGEESQRQLADAISKNTVEIQQGKLPLEEMEKGLQDSRSRLLSVEDGLSKVTQQTAELQNMRQELTRQQAELLENERRAERARTQTLAEWGRKMDGYTHQLDTWAEQLRFFADQHEKNRRVLRDAQMLAQELSQGQDRLRQLQRIAEDTLRREMREWRSESDQRWAQEMARRERLVETQAQRDSAQEEQLSALEGFREEAATALEGLDTRLDALRADLAADANKIKQAQRSMLQSLSKSVQSMTVDLQDALGGEG